MKIILLSVLFLSSLASAAEIKVSRMTNEGGMERSFLLKSNYPVQVTLDCHSFIQGLYLGPRSDGQLLMLEPWECEDLYTRIRTSLRSLQKHCIDVEDVVLSDYSCL